MNLNFTSITHVNYFVSSLQSHGISIMKANQLYSIESMITIEFTYHEVPKFRTTYNQLWYFSELP